MKLLFNGHPLTVIAWAIDPSPGNGGPSIVTSHGDLYLAGEALMFTDLKDHRLLNIKGLFDAFFDLRSTVNALRSELTSFKEVLVQGCPDGQALVRVSKDGVPICVAIQRRVVSGCPEGQAIRAITDLGDVSCQGPDFAVVQRRGTATCPPGSLVQSIDALGEATCKTPDYAVVQKRGNGTCPMGTFMRELAASGDAICAIVPINTSVVQRRITGTCGSSAAILGVGEDGTVACDTPMATRVGSIEGPSLHAGPCYSGREGMRPYTHVLLSAMHSFSSLMP